MAQAWAAAAVTWVGLAEGEGARRVTPRRRMTTAMTMMRMRMVVSLPKTSAARVTVAP